MLNFDGLRDLLIKDNKNFEWNESDVSDDDFLEESDHNSESEQDNKDDQDEENEENNNNQDGLTRRGYYYLGKDKITKLKKTRPVLNARTQNHNIVLRLPIVIKIKPKMFERLNTLSIYFLIILFYVVFKSFKRERDCKLNNVEEIKIFIGLLILTGLAKSNHQNLYELWEQGGLGVNVCRLTMNVKRFKFLLRCLRFDDYRDRVLKKEIDKLAPIREIFEMFVNNFEKYYSVGEFVTIDKQLVAFWGRFHQYIKSKPSRYGIKIFSMTDSQTWYTSKDIVKRLVRTIERTGRNLTIDNWFCSIPLVDDLFKTKITVVGTIRSNKRELLSFVNIRNRKLQSSQFGFKANMTLVMHNNDNVNDKTHKPEKIEFYNMTEGAVDTVDQMVGIYSVSRTTRRYPLKLFFHLIDIACLNSFIIYHLNKSDNKMSRRQFLKKIGLSLVQNEMKKRASNKYMPRNLRDEATQFLSLPSIKPVENLTRAVRCTICPRKHDIKIKTFCHECNQPMCKNHMILLCRP
ncbi:hypothetical protein ACFW04_013915 [Cataglyphis niger]